MDFVRSGDDTGIIQKNRPYHVVIESSEHRQFEMPMSHEEFLDLLVCLRYYKQISEAEREEALKKLSETVTSILKPPALDTPDLMQLDLVTNARELYALPFEAALSTDQQPLLANETKPVILTRRVPQSFAEKALKWPPRPRVLFVHASPDWVSAPPVPAADHKEALLKALQPWIDPLPDLDIAIGDEKTVLTILAEASLEDIKQTIQKAFEENKPYTHVHLLAHGVEIKDPIRPHRNGFGVALRSQEQKGTQPKEIVEALLQPSLTDKAYYTYPVMVSMAICDGGNQSNTITESSSLAQELHRQGVAIVIASQLPLTFPGSKIMTEILYKEWMRGADIREALHRTRVALHKDSHTYHDWVSMVAYVRLPEGYSEYLMDVRLQSQLAALDTASRYADLLLKKGIEETWQYNQITDKLQYCITTLESFLKQYASANLKVKSEVIQENTGLLGSAYKRLAELLFRRSIIDSEKAEEWKQKSRSALEKACEVYRSGFLHNTSHHWSGVQYLALQAVLTGKIEKVGEWYACQVAAERELEQASLEKNKVWALGSLAELNLLASVTPGAPYDQEVTHRQLQNLYQIVQNHKSLFIEFDPILSTRRQMSRYVDWWTQKNGFFPEANHDLNREATPCVRLLAG